MNITKIGKICGNQDGAIWKDYLFRFKATEDYEVYNLKNINLNIDNGELSPIYKTRLDRFSEINFVIVT